MCKKFDTGKVLGDLTNHNLFNKLYPIFGETINLFFEVVNCFKCETYLASAVMLRGTLDSLIYTLALLRIENKQFLKRIDELAKMDRRCRLNYALRIVKEQGYFKKNELEQIRKIRKDGNFSAHLVERIYEGFHNKPKEPVDLWIKDCEAYKILTK